MTLQQKLASLIHRLHCGEIEEDVKSFSSSRKTTTKTKTKRSDLLRHIPFNPSMLKRHNVVDDEESTVISTQTVDEKEETRQVKYYKNAPIRRFSESLDDFSPSPDLVHIAESYKDNKLNLPPPLEQTEYDRTIDILYRSSCASAAK